MTHSASLHFAVAVQRSRQACTWTVRRRRDCQVRSPASINQVLADDHCVMDEPHLTIFFEGFPLYPTVADAGIACSGDLADTHGSMAITYVLHTVVLYLYCTCIVLVWGGWERSRSVLPYYSTEYGVFSTCILGGSC
jgi:hypothetical protein